MPPPGDPKSWEMGKIRVDKEGKWYYEGREIIRRDILSLFYQGLRRDEEGRYFLQIGEDKEFIEVEDTVFVVEWAELRKEGGEEFFLIGLNDGSSEKLDLSTIRISGRDIPYCDVKGGFPARFRPLSFYQVAQHAQYDERRGEYYLLLNGRRYRLGPEKV